MPESDRIPGSHAEMPIHFVASGELGNADRILLTQLLGRFGLNVQSMDPAQYEKYLNGLTGQRVEQELTKRRLAKPECLIGTKYRFEALTQPDHFMTREHLEHFAATRPIKGHKLPAQFVGRVFTHLVDGRAGWRPAEKFTPTPPAPIEVKSRASLGLDRYEGLNAQIAHASKGILRGNAKSSVSAQYAVNVGSLVQAYEQDFMPEVDSTRGLRLGVYQVAEALAQQIQPDENK